MSRPARTHGRSAVRAPARSAHPARVSVSAGSALRRPRLGPGRAAAVGATAGCEASSRRRPAGRLPFVLEPRPRRAAVNGLGTRRWPISSPRRPRPTRIPPRAPPRPRAPALRAPSPGGRPARTRRGWAGRTCRGARRAPIGRASERGLAPACEGRGPRGRGRGGGAAGGRSGWPRPRAFSLSLWWFQKSKLKKSEG